MPYEENPHFVGRKELLKNLRIKLCDVVSKQYNHRIALYGLGGCGKTQIAVEYIYRHFDEYQVILWISSSNIEKIEKDFAKAALLLGLDEANLHANEARQFALQTLVDGGAYSGPALPTS